MELDIGRSSRRRTDLKAGAGNYTSVITVDVQVREPCDFTEPVFILTRFNNYESCNYVYVAHWNRYYFINEITVNGNLIELHCVEDYLASWYSQIASQSLFCTRSASDPNLSLADNTFPRESRTVYKQYDFNSPFTGFIQNNKGFFVLAINGSKPIINNNNTPIDAYIGTTNYYIFTPDAMVALCEKLYDSSLITSIERWMDDPMKYFARCYYMPIDIDDVSKYIMKTSDHFTISFGPMSLDIDADVYIWAGYDGYYISDPPLKLPTFSKRYNLIPNSDFFNTTYPFTNHAPYSHLYLWAQPNGLIELGDNVVSAFYNSNETNPLMINYTIDITSGKLLICIETDDCILFYQEVKCSIDIQLAEMVYNFGDIINGLTSIGIGAAALATGSTAAMGAGVNEILAGVTNSFMASVSPNVETNGNTIGSFNTIGTSTWHLIRTYNPVNLYPSAYGLPCCKTETLGNLTGFAQFEPVNIKTANGMLAKEQAEIEALLRRGVFINE